MSYEEPRLPQFIWNSTMTVLSIDSHLLRVERIRKSVKSIEEEMQSHVKKLTQSIDFSDLFQYIDSRMNPDEPDRWFIDHPREDLPSTSMASQDVSGLST